MERIRGGWLIVSVFSLALSVVLWLRLSIPVHDAVGTFVFSFAVGYRLG